VIFDANPIGATCARVCPVEVLCEGACVEKTLLKKPIEIGRLQRYATDYALTSDKQIFTKGESNGKSVGSLAVVQLASRARHIWHALVMMSPFTNVVRKAGGLDTYGMAEYKMPQAVSLSEAEHVANIGVKFLLNTLVTGGDEETEELGQLNKVSMALLREWHDAIFLATGLGATNRLGIPGEDLVGVIDALYFIERVKSRDWKSVPLGKNVAVIGAGNTAVDAVTQAKRLGADKVMMIYRRTERMPLHTITKWN
jgi:glutamate synthase (NADPH/NADH) small chain